MGASQDGIIKIRRSWTEDGIQVAIGLVVTLIAIFAFDKGWLAAIYLPWTVVFLSMNRHMGIDLTPTTAVVRTMLWRSRTVRREDITDVTLVKLGSSSFVGLQVRELKRPVKLTIKQSFGSWGKQRLAETHAQIHRWWLETAAVPVPAAQMPGSASI